MLVFFRINTWRTYTLHHKRTCSTPFIVSASFTRAYTRRKCCEYKLNKILTQASQQTDAQIANLAEHNGLTKLFCSIVVYQFVPSRLAALLYAFTEKDTSCNQSASYRNVWYHIVTFVRDDNDDVCHYNIIVIFRPAYSVIVATNVRPQSHPDTKPIRYQNNRVNRSIVSRS